MKEGEILKDRAERFLENGVYLFKKEQYDLAAFNIEQSCQLFLKYSIWKILGDFEKTHSIEELLNQFKEINNEKANSIEKIQKEFYETIADLEMVYIEARYLPAQFFKNQIEKMINFANQLKEIIF